MPVTVPTHHHARIAIRRRRLRRLVLDFARGFVPSSDCAGAETVASAPEGGDGRKAVVPAVQEYRQKRTDLRRGTFS